MSIPTNLQACQVVMPAQVEVRVRDQLQFSPVVNPQTGALYGTVEWADFCRSRLGKLAEVKGIIWALDAEKRQRFGAPAHPTPEEYLDLQKLKFEVVFQEETEVHRIDARHFVNHAPRAAPY